MQSNNESFLARFGQAWSSAVARLSTRAALWSVLTRAPRHPVASLLDRQLQRERRLQVLPLSMAISLVLLFLIARIYLSINEALIWSLPLLLMFFSAPHCVIWISRIVTLQSRGASDGVVDEVSMIPPGRIYIYLAICRVVLNADDALFWLHLLRRVLGGFVFLGLCFSLCIALTQMGTANAADIGRLLFEVLLVAVVIVLEHSQTIVLACLLAVAISPSSVGVSTGRASLSWYLPCCNC